jgi:CheY-like chemotaxis protein
MRAEVLMVEDNPADVELARESFQHPAVCEGLRSVPDGDQALAYLRRLPPFEDASRPDLVLLDLNLPRRDGHELLAEIKRDPDLRSIPVVVFSSSESDADVRRTYDLGANCFVTKPTDLGTFIDRIRAIEEFWLWMVKRPTSS